MNESEADAARTDYYRRCDCYVCTDTPGVCNNNRESGRQSVHPYDGNDMVYVPIDQSVLYGVWKNDAINTVIEVSGDKPHMVILKTESSSLRVT